MRNRRHPSERRAVAARPRLGAALALAGAVALGACSSSEAVPRPEGVDAAPATTVATSFEDNPFIPENANLGDCVSSLPRPDCGSEERGGWHELATFGALLGGTAFIGWRIARGVRRREATQPDVPDRPAR